MSEAGLPGAGVKLGEELFRGPKGTWFSGEAAPGADVGVLRFDPEVLAGEGTLPALIARVVEARAGRLPGAATVVDLVEDDGEVWLITAEVPGMDTATRTVDLLLAPSGQPPEAAVPPAAVVPPPVPEAATVPMGSRIGLAIRVLVGLTLVGGIIAGAAIAGNKVRSKPRTIHLQIAGILVESPAGFTSTSICNAALPMKAVLQTNSGTGDVVFEWDLPGSPPVKATKTVTGDSPQEVHLDWQLRLHGKGTVTAKFVVDNAAVLAPGTVATASTTLSYQCP